VRRGDQSPAFVEKILNVDVIPTGSSNIPGKFPSARISSGTAFSTSPSVMTQHENLTVLVSILFGLGVTDLVQSLCDLLHPTAALALVASHLDARGRSQCRERRVGGVDILLAPVWPQPGAFRILLFSTLNLYFLGAFALPDLKGPPEVDRPDRLDLKSFYFWASHRRVFFGAALVFIDSFLRTTSVTRVTNRGARPCRKSGPSSRR